LHSLGFSKEGVRVFISPQPLLKKTYDGDPHQGRGSAAAPAHRDEYDEGRYQCVIALSQGAFDVWPHSHKLQFKTAKACSSGHYHFGESFESYLKTNCEQCIFACSPGDVLIFKGGSFAHGSPAIGGNNPSPRVMTYATFWPPSTKKGMAHLDGKCGKPFCAALRAPFKPHERWAG